MNPLNHHRRSAAALLAMLCAQSALAGTVTVDVTTRPADSAADAVIVFDPLDAVTAPSHETAIIDQVNKRFVPRVSVVRTGTAVTFPNSDNIRHQVYSFSDAKKFTLKLYAGSPHTAVVFDQPGLVILGCNIHDSMVAYVGVVDSPYFAKLTDSGTTTLESAGRALSAARLASERRCRRAFAGDFSCRGAHEHLLDHRCGQQGRRSPGMA